MASGAGLCVLSQGGPREACLVPDRREHVAAQYSFQFHGGCQRTATHSGKPHTSLDTHNLVQGEPNTSGTTTIRPVCVEESRGLADTCQCLYYVYETSFPGVSIVQIIGVCILPV